MSKRLYIFGGGGFAREVAWLVTEINRTLPPNDLWNVAGFVEESKEHVGQKLNGIPIVSLEDIVANELKPYAVVAIGATEIREKAVQQAQSIDLRFATLIHPNVLLDKASIKIGQGTIICAGNILTVNINIGDHVIINLDCTIGHDSVIEDLVTISPGCHLSGYTTVRRGAYLGTGAVTVEKHEIGPQAIIGAGAVVVRDIPGNVTAVGVPARPIS